ncbi:MAG TPA: 4Fe-4S dicluster domain-containing protein [Acidobacteriota bacterium]
MEGLVQRVRSAGVVGAGGAGFPTYKKLEARAELLIANGAECEPLLFKDKVLMERYPAEIVDGMTQAMRQLGASRGQIAIKGKNRAAIDALRAQLPASITIAEMDDVYPAGDEYEVVYHCTGRRIPAGGIPLELGVVVQNVETLYNIHRAAQGLPVTHSMLTVHGQVATPLTAWFPIGMSYAEVLQVAGGATLSDFVLIDGGPMMGKVVTDLATPVTRISSGLIVVPKDMRLAERKAAGERTFKRIGKSVCDQCSLCTEMCPRYLLGYPIKPHLVMRSLLTTGAMSQSLTHWAQACCECNICTLWACPEDLDPRNICVVTKRDLKQAGGWLEPERLRRLSRDVHAAAEFRRVPTKRLVRKLGLAEYKKDAPFYDRRIEPDRVAIPLQGQGGAPATSTVRAGDRLRAGNVVAQPAPDAWGVPLHASISGIVRSVGAEIAIERIA